MLQRLNWRNRGVPTGRRVGIVCHQDTLRVMVLKPGVPKPTVTFYETITVSGSWPDALKALVTSNGLAGATAQFCLPVQDYQLLLTPKPAMVDDDSLRVSLLDTLKADLDDAPENTMIEVFPAINDREGNPQVYAAASSRQWVTQAVQMALAAGLKMGGIDIAALCLGRALPQEFLQKPSLYLHLEPRAGAVMLFAEDEFQFGKRLPRGLHWLMESVGDPATSEVAVNDLAVALRRAADEYQRRSGRGVDDLQVLLPPLPVYTQSLVNALQDALGWPVKVLKWSDSARFASNVEPNLDALGVLALGAVA